MTLQIVASLTDDSRGVIYVHNISTIQATTKVIITIPALADVTGDKLGHFK